MSPHHCVLSAIMYDYWRACNNLVERPQFNPVIYFMLLAYCIKKLLVIDQAALATIEEVYA